MLINFLPDDILCVDQFCPDKNHAVVRSYAGYDDTAVRVEFLQDSQEIDNKDLTW